MGYRTLDQISLAGRRVFMRADFNVPLDKQDGRTITSDTRIRKALPTVETILGRGASLVLASHLGRPKGQRLESMSLRPVAERLGELLGTEVALAPDCIGPEVETLADSLEPGRALLLENLRFHAQEQANDAGFSAGLARLGDAFVNDAFGTAHRAHASTVGVPAVMPDRAAGLLMQRELEYFSMATSNPRRPYVAIIGGAKISGKIDVIRNLLSLADRVLIGGAMTYTFLKASGARVGDSLVEEDRLGLASELLEIGEGRLAFPEDHVIADSFSADANVRTVESDVPDGWMGLDIGPRTIESYRRILGDARMIVWNGPMGVFEIEAFAAGTLAIARCIESVSDKAVTIVGGGDSERAIRAAGVGAAISHISTGGGASLEFLSGAVLPGVAALA
ncbi:MAG: phosphoglycerate kinase [Bryobacterales bacterium]|nr:phosphoglycerate kinase [Bryobacterales bacterium]